MSKRTVTNKAASVRQRLLNLAKKSGRPFNEILQHYALERWLYRLCQSEYAERFVLKGALLLRVWDMPISRPTRDIDLLAHSSAFIRRSRGSEKTGKQLSSCAVVPTVFHKTGKNR